MTIAAVLIPLVLQYGPSAVTLIEQLAADLKPLFADGGQPTEEQLAAVFARLDDAHARLQATR